MSSFGRAFAPLVAAMLGAAFIPACGLISSNLTESPCSYAGLHLVLGVVCFKNPPTVKSNGTWTWPSSDPKTKLLHRGSIIIVAKKAVRRVTSVRPKGSDVTVATAPVPLTEVIANGTIPLAPKGRARVLMSQVDPANPKPVQLTPTPGPTTPVATVTVRSSVVRARYAGTCPPPPDSAPAFQAVIAVSATPATVTYQWQTSVGGGSGVQALDFPAGGPLHQVVSTNPADLSDQAGTGWIKIAVTGPNGQTASSAERAYQIICETVVQVSESASASASTSPSESASASPSVSASSAPKIWPGQDRPVKSVELADTRAAAHWQIGRYSITPTLSFSHGMAIGLTATCKLGRAVLTFSVSGTLGDFTSHGSLHIRNHQLTNSGMGGSGLRGNLVATWSLSAAVRQSLLSHLSLNVAIPLFSWPLLAGDFPIFLAAQAQLHVAPDFGQSASVLHGTADISFHGSQGLTMNEQSAPRGHGGLEAAPPVLRFGRAIPFELPELDVAVTFPYLTIGDDFYDLTSALVWFGFTLDATTSAGTVPALCLYTDAQVYADVGISVQLFGLASGAAKQLYDHHVGPSSFPANPVCSP
jgi:hypothetical protein